MTNVGLISTGKMGRTIGMSLQDAGHEIFFASENRKEDDVIESFRANFKDVGNISNLASYCDALICIGTKNIALEVASHIFMTTNFKGLYLDLNSMNGEEEEHRWRSLINGLTDSYAEGAVRGYPFKSLAERPQGGEYTLILSGSQENDFVGLFRDTIWNTIVTQTPAKTLNRHIAVSSVANIHIPKYQDKTGQKVSSWETEMMDNIASTYYIDGRTGAETMAYIWEQIKSGKLREMTIQSRCPEQLGFIHAINTFSKHLTVNEYLDKPKPAELRVWLDPEFVHP